MREKEYRIYVTDTLRLMGENAAQLSRGSYIQKRYAEIIDPPPEDNRSGREIAEDVAKSAGITIKKNSA